MREKRSFAQRSITEIPREAKKKYFLVYEGEETEQIYFEVLNEHRDMVGINPLIELIPLVRSYSEIGWSNPKKILDRVLLNLEENQSRKISYETLLNWIMEYLYDIKILTTSKVMAKGVWGILEKTCIERLAVNLKEEVENIEETLGTLVSDLAEKTEIAHLVSDIPAIIKEQSFTYDCELDKICFIIDRDGESFVSNKENNQYDYVVKKCSKNAFGLYISNPCFEFWLLLHYDEVQKLDKEKLLQNARVSAKRRYTESELRKLLPGFTKSKYNVEELMQRVNNAIENEKKFCEDVYNLESELGSRVGVLIAELRG